MSNDTWLTAAQAAKILRVTERQVNRYGADGRLSTQRAGRRVSYLASDVARLADELQVDKRPLSEPRQNASGDMIPPALIRQMQEQEARYRRIDERLNRIDQRFDEPARLNFPRWLVIGFIVLVVAVVLTFLLVLFLGIRAAML